MNHDSNPNTGIFAVGTLLATDDLVADELSSLGLTVRGRALGWVTAEGTIQDAYRALLWTRVGDRVVWVLDRKDTPEAVDFRALVNSIDWNRWLYPGHALRVDVTGKMHWLKDTRFAGQLVMDAVRDQAAEAGRPRPDYDAAQPHCRIAVRFGRGTADIGITLNLTPLNQRGYRTEGGEAPIRETLAQVMLARLKVDRQTPDFVMDPCCGSGTLLIEAAMRQANMAPQRNRTAEQLCRWTGLAEISWSELVADAKSKERPLTLPFQGFDIDSDSVERARSNIERAGLSGFIEIDQGDFTALDQQTSLPKGEGWILANPPYGVRLGRKEDLFATYKILGEQLKAFEGSQLGIVSSNPELIKAMALRATKKWTLQAGGHALTISHFALGPVRAHEETMDTPAPPPEAVIPLLNRLDKNLDKRRKLLKNNDINCYRLYDAELPEFNVIIDRFGDHLHIQEYRPPKTIDPAKAHERRQLIRQWVPKHLGLPIKQAVYKERFRQQGKTQYEKRDAPVVIQAEENGLLFEVNLSTYTDVGLFLDHRPLRRWLMNDCKGRRVLNLFCYTGALSVAAAKGYARSVTSVDASKTYLGWAQRNFQLNGLNPKHYEFIRTNILKWITIDPSPQYDVIILDPPTFSNTKDSEETLDIQRDHAALIEACMKWLAPQGVLYFSNNFSAFKLDSSLSEQFMVSDLTQKSLDPDFDRKPPHVLYRIGLKTHSDTP